MKLILCCCIIMLCTSCSSTFSPVGQWDLYAQQNNILERLTPHVQMNIYENGEFVCTAIEKNDTTKNNGKWNQIAGNLFFEDNHAPAHKPDHLYKSSACQHLSLSHSSRPSSSRAYKTTPFHINAVRSNHARTEVQAENHHIDQNAYRLSGWVINDKVRAHAVP